MCPFYGCDITKRTCGHLDRYLSYEDSTYTDKESKKVKGHEVSLVYTNDIDEYSLGAELRSLGVWDLFKKLRRYGLDRDQIGILVRKFGKNMTNRQIIEDMGWTSHNHLYRRYKQALHDLAERGLKRRKHG